MPFKLKSDTTSLANNNYLGDNVMMVGICWFVHLLCHVIH